ncbi:MAG TPA: hypothetical protein PJ986_10530 [Gammaproteobacteria bacterium]|nr:hypothetical protein [Gammaproteobacteria bacterium]
MSTSNRKTMDLLVNTLVGIDVVASRELDDPSGGEPRAELAIIMHAAMAALDLLKELQLAKDDDEDGDDEAAGDGKPPKLSIVD